MSEVSANPGCDIDDAGGKNPKEPGEEQATVENDVQRAIEGLKGMPDDELQEFLNDDFMKDLDVVDAWEGDEDKAMKDARGPRVKDRARISRERQRRDRKSPHGREQQQQQQRPKREERRREDARRDPSKSSKDIERDKIRTKKDTDSKILAEKEKAIKHLLDSDDVVPPGTEVEAIQSITERQQQQRVRRVSRERRRSQERTRPSPSRRRSNDRIRLSPHRRISDERRQIRMSPERRRNAASPPNLRRSWERRASRERSIERHRRREERELRLAGSRRSRSRERQRSRSSERYRKRWSRSPLGRRSSPRRHSRSRSRSPERRARKRSPFINELARTFRNEGLLPAGASNFLPGIPPLMGQGFPHDHQTQASNPAPPMPQFMHHPGAPAPGAMHMQAAQPPFVSFEPHINFEPGRGPIMPMPHGDYTAGPIIYSQANPPILVAPNLTMPMQSPQPVPAPAPTEHPSIGFNQQTRCVVNIPTNAPQQQQQPHADASKRPAANSPRRNFKEAKSTATSMHNGATAAAAAVQQTRPERLKTPEPPIISNSKPFEKTSLSSLLEASVSAKDSHGLPVLYPGFKPEILRQCELALRDLPAEDLRLRMKGRFFYDPCKEDPRHEPENLASNSILLRTGKSQIYWEEAESEQMTSHPKPAVEMHQKICQTEETETESRGVQAVILPPKADFSMQVSSYDIQQAAKEEKRPIMDRLDWNVRENYEYATKIREADDLRWSLSNSSQKRPWNRVASPPASRVIDEERELSPSRLSSSDRGSRGINVGSSTRSRDNYSFRRSSSREHYSRERYSPTYRRRSHERTDDFRESRSDHSRGESPMVLEDSPDEIEILSEDYPRGSEWRPRGKSTYRSPASGFHKMRIIRGKPAGRSYSSRGGFRGKF